MELRYIDIIYYRLEIFQSTILSISNTDDFFQYCPTLLKDVILGSSAFPDKRNVRVEIDFLICIIISFEKLSSIR